MSLAALALVIVNQPDGPLRASPVTNEACGRSISWPTRVVGFAAYSVFGGWRLFAGARLPVLRATS